MLSLSNSWGKYRTQTPIKSCATSVAATVQITVLLAIKIFFFLNYTQICSKDVLQFIISQ